MNTYLSLYENSEIEIPNSEIQNNCIINEQWVLRLRTLVNKQ